MTNKLNPGLTTTFEPKTSINNIDVINKILTILIDVENLNNLMVIIKEKELNITSIEECETYNATNKYIINCMNNIEKVSLYIIYNPNNNTLVYGLYTESDLIKDSQYNSYGLYGQNHPSGYRLWGYDDESICFNDDQLESGKGLFWLQDEPKLYDQILALCIKYYHNNKERIEKDQLPTDV